MFDETSGSTANDVSGNENSGTLTNMDLAANWVSGQIHGALEFDGVDDLVVVSPAPRHAKGNDFSISFWMMPDTSTRNDVLISRWDDSTEHRSWAIAYASDEGELRFDTSNNGLFQPGNKVTSARAVADGQWSHVVALHTDGINTLFIDGSEDRSTRVTNRGVFDTNLALYVGHSPAFGSAPQHFDGAIDDVRIYDRALAAEEVQDLHDTGRGDTTPLQRCP
jgi:hypothetical protein